MLVHPNFNPVFLRIGRFSLSYYYLMYIMGFIIALILGLYRAKRSSTWTVRQATVLIFPLIPALIIGARLGFVLFYDFPYFSKYPYLIPRFWEGGMSFHGGFTLLLTTMFLFALATGKGFYQVTDFVAPLVPIGLGLGRIGNFINGELFGRPTEMPWGMFFRSRWAGNTPRHPSQLYEMFLEGFVLFLIVWIYSSRPRPEKGTTGMFMFFYGCFRFFVEFFRMPDLNLGFIAFGWLTMGQLLSLPIILWGAILIYLAHGRGATQSLPQVS